GSVCLVAKEPRVPYDRPPLTKGFMNFKPADPADIESKDSTWYPNNNVDVKMGVEVVKLDRSAKEAHLSDGTVIGYEKALLATGSTPHKIDLPGSDLANVFLFRYLDWAEQIREIAKEVQNIVLIGGGYIGMELGASFTAGGHNVTIIDHGKHPWGRLASPITGNFLRSYFENKGVRFLFEDAPEQIAGEGRVQTVRTKNLHAAPADLVVIGTGVQLNTKIAKDAGLTVDDKHGVSVNEFLQSEDDPSIWVAGDIANFKDVVMDQKWHIEHHMHAKWTGNAAGKNMAGANQRYERVPYFFSDMFDLQIVIRGNPAIGRSARILGDLDTAEFVELYTNGDEKVVGAIGVTRIDDRYGKLEGALEAVIKDGKHSRELSLGDVGLD
ncbi:MAG TPA: FAD-dependent oxidoreductase, partial [Fimbriimonas sp.]|nr:FAD-dependent oxidoreductase [Fimbriimonas sp.]